MITVIDTSLLLSLAMDDEHSEKAEEWWHENPGAVWVPELVAFEARNVLRSYGLQGVLSAIGWRKRNGRWKRFYGGSWSFGLFVISC